MRTIAIIQARMLSTRLPGKMLLDLEGKTLIQHIIERVSRARRVDGVVVATSLSKSNDLLVEHVSSLGVLVCRGEEDDVLGRYWKAAEEFGADVVVRVTGDDPMKDPDVIDRGVEMFFQRKLDFTHNCRPPSYPEGLDVEVFSHKALEAAALEATSPFEREHVTPYLYAHPERFSQARFGLDRDLSGLRWTLDTQEDLEFARAVYAALYPVKRDFRMAEILGLLERQPELGLINDHIERSHHYKEVHSHGG